MKNITLIQEMVAIADTLKGSKLKNLNKIDANIERVRKRIGLASKEEVMTLVAIFDRQCSEETTAIEDLSSYLCCSSLEAMTLVPTLNSLLSKGYIYAKNTSEWDLKKKRFQLLGEVFNAIVDGGEICPTPVDDTEGIDSFVFCTIVLEMVKNRSNGQISTKELFARVSKLEDEHPEVVMTRTLKKEFSDVATRLWFYYMCYNFSCDFEGGATSLTETLKDIYDNISQGIIVKKALLEGSYPLIKADLIYKSDNEDKNLHLSDKGITLLCGENATIFIKSQKCADKYEFVDKVEKLILQKGISFGSSSFYKEIEKLEENNEKISFIAITQKLVSDIPARILFYLICKASSKKGHISIDDLYLVYMRDCVMRTMHTLKEKKHILQKQGLIELKAESFLENSALELTDKGKEIFFEEDLDLFFKVNNKDIIDNTKIAEKRLFFEPSLENQLSILQDSLQKKNLVAMRQRLKENKLPLGFAALLYGQPGTGKTESVMQMARATGRSIMHVDISEVKTCLFGESQKLIKAIFTKYRKLCEKSKVAPILLLNEADAILSKRKDSNFSRVAQEENAIQNIILEEIESLDGILIATTNFVSNLDKAFERRFLFKIHFDKPTLDSKKHIWKDKLPYLNDKETHTLASSFDFSGGEIDNIVRKATISEVISGDKPNLEGLITLCKQEKITSSNTKIGF